MEKQLETYVTPQCEVMEMELQGVIAASLGPNDDYGSGGEGITFP
jgi:hypothetical protein